MCLATDNTILCSDVSKYWRTMGKFNQWSRHALAQEKGYLHVIQFGSLSIYRELPYQFWQNLEKCEKKILLL